MARWEEERLNKLQLISRPRRAGEHSEKGAQAVVSVAMEGIDTKMGLRVVLESVEIERQQTCSPLEIVFALSYSRSVNTPPAISRVGKPFRSDEARGQRYREE